MPARARRHPCRCCPVAIRSAVMRGDLDCVIAKARVLAHVRVLVVEHHGARRCPRPRCRATCASQNTAFLRVSVRVSPRAIVASASRARSPRCIASRGQRVLADVAVHAGARRLLLGQADEPARAVVDGDVAELLNRRLGLHRAACRQHAQALDLAAGRARIHSHGIGRRVVAAAGIATVVVELAGLLRCDSCRPNCSSNTSPARLRRRPPASSPSRRAAA